MQTNASAEFGSRLDRAHMFPTARANRRIGSVFQFHLSTTCVNHKAVASETRAPCRHYPGQGVPVCLPVGTACARAGERAHHRAEFALVQGNPKFLRGPSLSCGVAPLAPV